MWCIEGPVSQNSVFVIDLCTSETFQVDVIFPHCVEILTFRVDEYYFHDIIGISLGMSNVSYVLVEVRINIINNNYIIIIIES